MFKIIKIFKIFNYLNGPDFWISEIFKILNWQKPSAN